VLLYTEGRNSGSNLAPLKFNTTTATLGSDVMISDISF
jgi:hypothetical protein